MSPEFEIQLVAVITAIACSIPGVFLVLRKMALVSDAISHSILPGLVIGFFITHNLNSPLLILCAAITGVLTVILVEKIQATGLVKEDTAIGLVFPLFFSVGVILIAQFANDVHLDIDAVLLGELAFVPFDRWIFSGYDLGPAALWSIGCILVIVFIGLLLFFKELKVTTFDVGLASSMGFSPLVIHYGLMSVTSVTTVGAFQAVGAILVVALIIAPPATAYLLTKDLKKMLWLACGFGALAAIGGYWLSYFLDASIAGCIATVLGLIFLLVYLFAPAGVIAVALRRKKQKREVKLLTFLLHINNHKEAQERHIAHLGEHINWSKTDARRIIALSTKNNMITIHQDVISLTRKGKTFVDQAITYITSNKASAIETMKEHFLLFRG